MRKSIKVLTAFAIITTSTSIGLCFLSSPDFVSGKAENNETWGHYSFVSPTLENNGCREFYISCDSYRISFTRPDSTKIIERGTPSKIEIDSWVSKNDGRVIPNYRISDSKYQLGLYPQSRVTDEALLDTLQSLTETYENGYYFFDGTYYAKAEATPKTDYTFDDGAAITSGNTYWFKVEPITWKVLSSEDGKHFLTTEMILDCHEYNNLIAKADRTDYQGNVGVNVYGINYKYSTLRSYLNASFLDKAFFLDNGNLLETIVDNSEDTTVATPNQYACEDTTDKLFALSYEELNNTNYFVNNTARICKTTDYARCVGAYSSTVANYINNGWYYTRSPINTSAHVVSYVYHAGYIYDGLNLTYSDAGIRPALYLQSN